MQNIHELVSSLVLLLFLFFCFASLSSQCVRIALFTWSAEARIKTRLGSAMKIDVRSVKIDICVDSAEESARRNLRMTFRKTFSDCLMMCYFCQENCYTC